MRDDVTIQGVVANNTLEVIKMDGSRRIVLSNLDVIEVFENAAVRIDNTDVTSNLALVTGINNGSGGQGVPGRLPLHRALPQW